MHCDFYNLPDITIIGGDTFPIYFDLFRDRTYSMPYDMDTNFVAYFSVVSYLNRESAEPLMSFASNDTVPRVSITADADGTFNNVVVAFHAEDTALLSGKFIYQITLEDTDRSEIEVLGQGTMTIIRNIDPDLIITRG